MTWLFLYLTRNRAGTRIGRATWLYFGLWVFLLITNDLLVHTMHVVPLSATEPIFIGFAVLSPLILLLNRLDTSGPTKEDVERVAREFAAEKEAEYIAKRETTWSYRLGKWVGRHKGLLKIVDIFSTRFGRFSLTGWLSIIVVVAALGTIFYHRTQYTNRIYLKELIESHTIEKTASEVVASARKVESAKGSDIEWKVIEQGLSNCMVREAKLYLESNDPYLFERANKITPRVLSTRFLKSCGAIE